MRETHQTLLSLLSELTDEDLQNPYSQYQPQAKGDYVNNSIVGWLVGDTYTHYAEHVADVGRLLRGGS